MICATVSLGGGDRNPAEHFALLGSVSQGLQTRAADQGCSAFRVRGKERDKLRPCLSQTLPPQVAMEQILVTESQTIESHPLIDRAEGTCPRAHNDSDRAKTQPAFDPQERWQEKVVSATVLGHETVRKRTPSSFVLKILFIYFQGRGGREKEQERDINA